MSGWDTLKSTNTTLFPLSGSTPCWKLTTPGTNAWDSLITALESGWLDNSSANGYSLGGLNNLTMTGTLSMTGQPHCRVKRQSAFSIPSGTATAVLWDTDVIDAQSMHSTSSNTQNLTAVAAGDHLVGCSILMGYSTSEIFGLLYVNGADTGVRFLSGDESSGNAVIAGAYPWNFNLGDVAAIYISQSSGSSIALNVGAYCTAFMYKMN